MNKFNKGKTIGILAASLSAISLMGVGFASWIINGANPVDVGNVTVNVANVEDKRVTITNATVDSEFNTIRFDADSTKQSGGILTASSGAFEALTFKITYTVTNTTKEQAFKVSAYLTDTDSKLTTATNNTHNLITMPANLGIGVADKKEALNFTGTAIPSGTGAAITETAVGTTYTVTQTFTFGWGSAFNSVNPVMVSSTMDVYDIQSGNSKKANADILKYNLTQLNGLNSATFVVTLVPQVTTTTSN